MNPASAFELIKWQKIKETKTDARFYRHKKTGAELLSMINDDENKVFGITFRTPPKDSTGVAHILEHSVLCGSRKYPVKEPFVELLKGSLQTFLNAFTYPDKTCYPVASQNLQDFYNLVDVYLDAVFYPRLTPQVYHQEGWHYEFDDSNQSLSYKGVVYNEMKGVYSSPSSLLMSLSGRSLFPDNTYGIDSGGDPERIPELTYEALVDFHRKYYHPSNSRIYFYGNDNPEKRLSVINEYLKSYERIEVDSDIKLQNKFQVPVSLEFPFASPEEEKSEPKGMMTMNWLLPETADAELNFAFHIIEYILIGMPASPLRKAMIDSGLGEGMAGVGLEAELRQMYFSTGLKGIDIKKVKAIEDIILKTLEVIVRDRIDALTVEAAVNTIEFNLREQNTGGFPRGLSQMLLALTSWLYNGDPVSLLAFEMPLKNVKEKIKNEPGFLENIIDNHLLKNQHRTTLILIPDPELSKKHAESERKKLGDIKSGLTPDNSRKIIEEAGELKKKQETPDSPEALAKIPMLKISDLDRQNKKIPVVQENLLGSEVLYHDIFTNNIFYLDLGFDIHTLPQKYIPYIPIFGQALLEMGTETEDYVKFSQRISGKTGGIKRSYFTSMLKNSEMGTAWLILRCKAMMDQTDELFGILGDMLLRVKLDDRDRFKQIALQMKTGREQGIIPQGNRMINLRLRSDYNEADWASEQINGISAIFFLRALLERIDSDWAGVLADLEDIKNILVSRPALILNATLDGKSW
ncbi:MAG: insulinase family protein, partial [Spirochaetes bacterium]|nr:insulinase family protein [Spirochaetota bacterium]